MGHCWAVLDGFISPTQAVIGQWRRKFDKSAERPHPYDSISTAMRGLDMIAIYNATDWKNYGSLEGVRFLPYHSGIAPGLVGMQDNDDAAIMNATLCSSVWYLLDGEQAQCRCDSGGACGAGRAHLPLGEEITRCDASSP